MYVHFLLINITTLNQCLALKYIFAQNYKDYKNLNEFALRAYYSLLSS